ncbi:hypothetical protein [Nitrosospira briensis]|uniref:hypothetical protein n=1 Tax=Nitrosospira briensis TaxID=35799 RepID=UPI00046AF9D1|nr:hypothetical protein [Nitrosospira briensis]
MTALIIFAATFVVVFALGFQSLNVNQGHHKAAFINSLIIGASNLVILKMIPASSSLLEIAAYLMGGPFGIVASMWVHRRTLGKNGRKP